MINITTKIHDKFSVEFKMGFSGGQQDRVSDFTVNSWFFVPNSLNINSDTYSKEQFYRDVSSNIRLITPTFELSELASENKMPLKNLQAATIRVLSTPNAFSLQEFDLQVKMYASIFKSSLRDATNRIRNRLVENDETLKTTVMNYVRHLHAVTRAFRCVGDQIKGQHTAAYAIFSHGDEFISHQIGIQVLNAYMSIPAGKDEERSLLNGLIQDELDYKKKCHYSYADNQDTPASRELIHRHSLLKKYMASVLYLKTDTTEDGAAMRELSFSLAAGLAMLISMLIALPFQKYLGNYPSLIFIILIVAYMFKDRIKEFARRKFVHHMKAKYFDHKCTMKFMDSDIGWIKEGVDFINDAQTLPEVLDIRNRSALEKDNRLFQEKIILYRKQVHIETKVLSEQNEYSFSGINDIMRFHIQQFTLKMDDPVIRLKSLSENGVFTQFDSLRIYPIYIVMQFINDGKSEYRGFRVQATRDGIVACDELTFTDFPSPFRDDSGRYR